MWSSSRATNTFLLIVNLYNRVSLRAWPRTLGGQVKICQMFAYWWPALLQDLFKACIVTGTNATTTKRESYQLNSLVSSTSWEKKKGNSINKQKNKKRNYNNKAREINNEEKKREKKWEHHSCSWSQFVELLLASHVVAVAHLPSRPPVEKMGVDPLDTPQVVQLRHADRPYQPHPGPRTVPTCHARHFTHLAFLQGRVVLKSAGRARPPLTLLRVGRPSSLGLNGSRGRHVCCQVIRVVTLRGWRPPPSWRRSRWGRRGWGAWKFKHSGSAACVHPFSHLTHMYIFPSTLYSLAALLILNPVFYSGGKGGGLTLYIFHPHIIILLLWFWCLMCLTPSLPQPVKFSGERWTDVPANGIYSLSMLCVLMKIPSHANVRKKTKGLRVSNFTLLMVVFKWHHGSGGVNPSDPTRLTIPCILPTLQARTQLMWSYKRDVLAHRFIHMDLWRKGFRKTCPWRGCPSL